MLRDFRKTVIEKEDNKNLEKFLGMKSRKFYTEKHYEKNILYQYLFFLRSKGGDINSFFDQKISQKKDL